MSKSEALNVLREIKESTFRNAVPLPQKEVVKAHWQGLGFLVGGVRLVSKLGEVSELIGVPKLTSLPAVCAFGRRRLTSFSLKPTKNC